MLKDFFQRNIELQNELRSQHFKASQYLNKGKYRMKQKFFGGGKKHYDFDMNSQQYFHQYVDDIAFENTEIQDIFRSHIIRAMDCQPTFHKPKIFNDLPNSQNPYQTRMLLSRHFRTRCSDLLYKKYLTMNRVHNSCLQTSIQQLKVIKSRIFLIEKEIQTTLNREARLSCEDLFQESYTQGGKPVPVNQNGQPIYKYLDEEQCWFSNISRDDIVVYARGRQYKWEILQDSYWPIYYQLHGLVFQHGIDILNTVEEQLSLQKTALRKRSEQQAIKFLSNLEKILQQLSPRNLTEKQNMGNFIYYITGINDGKYLQLPLYPAIESQLLFTIDQIIPSFFKSLQIKTHQHLINLLPKLNTFTSILFKYQNKQILQGKKEIKLGLDDDVNVRKQLITMLEELWVRKHVNLNFDRYDYKLLLRTVDWPLDTISLEKQRESKRQQKTNTKFIPDRSIEELIRLIRLTDYSIFRRQMKRRSQQIVNRSSTKYIHMEHIKQFNQKPDQTVTLQNLSQLYKVKLTKPENFPQILKPNTLKMFNSIIEPQLISNPAEVEVIESLKCIQIRQTRTQIMNVINGMRAYHRNICLDLRVLGGEEFKFELDDNFLINANKQTLENFEKAIKDSQTMFSKGSGESLPKRQDQQFITPKQHNSSMLYKKDKPRQQFFTSPIPNIFVSDGLRPKNNILYQIVLSDLFQLQQRLLKNSTSYINRCQRIIKIKCFPEIIDRVELLRDLFNLELSYQYQKFKLMQQYYYIYENTSEPLQAFKIAKIIVQLLHKAPELDLEEQYFTNSYQLTIVQLKLETESLKLFMETIQKRQNSINKSFHKKFAQANKIPLTLYAFLYGDLQIKNKHQSRMSRMSSVMSMKSKTSHNNDKLRVSNIKKHIKEQFAQDSEEEDNFDIDRYDQYLLQKDMDTIFEDMVQGNTDKDATPMNNVSIENMVVNPRFEGGPHPQNYRTIKVDLTTSNEQFITTFSDVLYWTSNLRRIIQELQRQFSVRYGYCSKVYQIAALKVITNYAKKVLMRPENKPPKWFQFGTDDPYSQLVTKCMQYYEQVMSAALEPPSQALMLIQNSIKIHQDKIPGFPALQYFDFHSLKSLCLLKKPANTVNYKELVLGINFIEFLELTERLWHAQLERKRTSRAYKVLGNHSECLVEKFSMQYTRGTQSLVFLSCQQLKTYNAELAKYPLFPDSISQLRRLIQCQLSDIYLFKTHVGISKLYLQNYIIMKQEIDKQFYINSRIDKSRLISQDAKNVKMIKNRINGLVNNVASEILKNDSFLKCKAKLKGQFQKNMQKIQNVRIQQIIQEDKAKLTPHCLHLLQQKYKRLLVNKAMLNYSKDLLAIASKNQVLLAIDNYIGRVANLSNSLPYLSKLFHSPKFNYELQKKVLYDQKDAKYNIPGYESIVKDGQITDNFYIYSREQILEQWRQTSGVSMATTSHDFTIDGVIQLNAPSNKNQLFSWIFRVKKNSLTSAQKEAMRHFLKVAQSFTGTLSQSDYTTQQLQKPAPPRNKFLTLMQHYQAILQYLQINSMIVSLQFDQQIHKSLQNLLLKNLNFQQTYPQLDSTVSFQSLQTHIIAPCFVYQVKKNQLMQNLKKKLQKKGYSDQKEYFAIIDEVTDFLISKVQGFGVIRQSFLPLAQELKAASTNTKIFGKFLNSRTKFCRILVWLSLWETYGTHSVSNNNSDFHHYLLQVCNAMFSDSKVQTFKASTDDNLRINIDTRITNSDCQKERFRIGIYNNTTNSIIEKLKSSFMTLPSSITSYLKKQFKSYQSITTDNQEEAIFQFSNAFEEGNATFQKMGTDNRMSLLSRIRMFNQLANTYLSPRSESISMVDKQGIRKNYAKFLMDTKIYLITTTLFSRHISFDQSATRSGFRQKYGQVHEICDMNTFAMYDRLQLYQNSGKIQFSKTDSALIGKSLTQQKQQFNKVIRQVIYYKLLRAQLVSELLCHCISTLKAQKCPKSESKKILNTSLIPRVHLIASYSSPLILQRKTYISQQYKLAFVQAFTNRFRNKVSRVDLLSSGYGFVITVTDLEDCLNFMNKLLFTFTEKEFKNRLETFGQYYQIIIQQIRNKNRKIQQQDGVINYLKEKVHNVREVEYLGKVSKLLMQKTIVQERLKEIEVHSQGLEDRVRKAVQLQYQQRLAKTQKQNCQLRKQFDQFKKVLVILTKDSTKNNFLNILNHFREKVNDLLNKKVDMTSSLQAMQTAYGQLIENKVKVSEQESSKKQIQRIEQSQEQEQQYDDQDIQKCKIGEDIIHDPYYVTKLINKMRLFNVFKIGSKKVKFEQEQTLKARQFSQLQKIQDTTILQSQRQAIMREELVRAQEELSKKVYEMELLKHTCQGLQNQKTKLKILLNSKDKKIQQRQRELQQTRRQHQQTQQTVQKASSSVQPQQLSLSSKPEPIIQKNQQLPKISLARENRKNIQKKLDRLSFMTSADNESSAGMSIYQKFQLSSKDTTWREKCQQLYIENKRLLAELEKLQTGATITPITPARQGYSLNMRQPRRSADSNSQISTPNQREHRKKFPNLSFKYGLLKQNQTPYNF